MTWALALAGATLLSAVPALGQTPPPEAAAVSAPVPPAAKRPRVALVLSGGGARAFAHIGVLRALREMRVPVDIVVGTSMGSVVGGAYAAGASISDLEHMARHTDWERVIADRPAREDLEFRRREEDVLLPSRIEFGVHRDGVSLPPSAAGNAALEQTLGRLLPGDTRDRPVNQLALPFRSVASDLVTGELVDLVDTPLFLTMRASLAVPGVFAPVRVNKRLVVDGGLVRNLPVDMAHEMGADIVIAVNVGTPLAPEKHLGSALGVAQQMINILTEQNVQRSIKELRPTDVLVAPELAGIAFLDFRRADAAIAAGEEAAMALASRLAPYALAPEKYAQLEQGRLAPPRQWDTPLRVASLKVETNGQINPKILEVQSGLMAGQKLTRDQVRQAADQLYGRGDLERVEADIEDQGSADSKTRSVTLKATEADWANSRLRVGLELASDFDDSNSFALKMMHVKTSLNPWGGELRTVARIGDRRELGMQFYQPLGPGSQWYVAPSTQYGSTSLDSFSDGRRLHRDAYTARNVSFLFGRELGTWGDIRIGLSRQRDGKRRVIPEPVDAPSLHGYSTNALVQYRVDTLDSLGFPSRGYRFDARVERQRESGNESTTRATLIGMGAFSTDNFAGHVYGEFAHAKTGFSPLSLGGFLRLSGTVPDSIQGRSVAFTRVVMARRIGALPVTLGGTVRGGFSFEAGGGFDLDDPAPGSRIKQAASAFLSVDTRFGPVYVGGGATKEGNRTMYLFLGPIW